MPILNIRQLFAAMPQAQNQPPPIQPGALRQFTGFGQSGSGSGITQASTTVPPPPTIIGGTIPTSGGALKQFTGYNRGTLLQQQYQMQQMQIALQQQQQLQQQQLAISFQQTQQMFRNLGITGYQGPFGVPLLGIGGGPPAFQIPPSPGGVPPTPGGGPPAP